MMSSSQYVCRVENRLKMTQNAGWPVLGELVGWLNVMLIVSYLLSNFTFNGQQSWLVYVCAENSGRDPSNVLREADVPIVAHQTCADAYEKHHHIDADKMTCAGYPTGQIDTCIGEAPTLPAISFRIIKAVDLHDEKTNAHKSWVQIKPPLHSRYYTEAYNEWRDPSPQLSAWTTQLRRNIAAVTILCPIWPASESNSWLFAPVAMCLATQLTERSQLMLKEVAPSVAPLGTGSVMSVIIRRRLWRTTGLSTRGLLSMVPQWYHIVRQRMRRTWFLWSLHQCW